MQVRASSGLLLDLFLRHKNPLDTGERERSTGSLPIRGAVHFGNRLLSHLAPDRR